MGAGGCPAPVPPEPLSCSDGVQSPDETGIDCGGSCISDCVLLCADGLEPIDDPASAWFDACYGGIFAMINNVCPPNTVEGTVGGACVGIDQPFYVSDQYTISQISAMGIPPVDYSYQGLDNVFTQDNTFISSDNGDGTTTETTTTTSTSGEGSSTTNEITTRTDIVNTTTSQIISSTITTVTEAAPTENPENYTIPSVGDVSDSGVDGDITADLPDLINEDGSFFSGLIDSMPFFAILDTFDVQVSSFECSVMITDVFGVDLDLSLCRWESYLRAVGAILLSIAQLYAFVIVYRGWK
jgi:hypothetical protein